MNTVHLVEQATLGSLLIHPAPIRQIGGWLRAEDFTDTWHRHVYAAIREYAAAGDPLWAARLGEVLTERLGPVRANLPRIHDLMVATPLAPHPVMYARMVLDTAIREQTAAQGVLLQAGALAAATRNPTALRHCLGLVAGNLASLERRWNTAFNREVPSESELAPVVALAGWRDMALQADRTLAQHPPVDQDTALEHEHHLIASLATHPTAIAQVAAWWRPDAVTDDTWRPVYAALVDLADRGQPVDLVTVSWQIHSASRRWGPGPNLSDLRDTLEAATTTDPAHIAALVAGDQLRHYADHAADLLRAAAANPGVDVADVLATGHLATTTLADLSHTITDTCDLSAPTTLTNPVPVNRLRTAPSTPALSVVADASVITR